MRKVLTAAGWLLAIVVAGCTAIRSTRSTNQQGGSGLVYYLPKGRIRIAVVKEVVKNELQQGEPTNQASLFITNITIFRQSATNNAPPALDSASGLTFTNRGEVTVSNWIVRSQTVFTNLTPTAVKFEPPKTNLYVSLEVDLIPDRAERNILAMRPSASADDYMKVGVSNGLLETVILTNSDQSSAVLSNLALAGIEFAKYAAVSAGAGVTTVTTTNVYYLDPFATDRETLCNRLRSGFGIRLNLDDFPRSTEFPTNRPQSTPGVFYRPLQAYQVTWDSPSGAGAATVYLPNAAPVFSLDVQRAWFVSQAYMLAIHQGIPTEVTLNKPSQVAAASSFPLMVARSLVSLPTNLLQLKIDYSSSKSKLLEAQNAQVTNLIRQIEAERQLGAEQSNALSGGSGKPRPQRSGGAGT
ncbi:MAG: hypothetical protein ABSF95_14720 [Verrucomicrobiota bacterium]|jgi:hypothetical protein